MNPACTCMIRYSKKNLFVIKKKTCNFVCVTSCACTYLWIQLHVRA